MTAKFRPKLTVSILQWALLDVAGMVVLAIGGFYLMRDETLIPGFPSSTLEAIAVVVVGIGMIFAAAVKMLAEIMAQAPQAGQGGKPDQE
jgi:type III secretory pathway component EscV